MSPYPPIVASFWDASFTSCWAAKILENTQRDLNIALMNEIMVLFDKMGIRSTEVIAAAMSKWNFHPYRPGLVGGHCISVDPYYLVAAGRRHGLDMELVAKARAVNESTPLFLVEKLERLFEEKGQSLKGKRILVLGRTFKEDCPDVRNSKAVPLMDGLWLRGADVFCYDPVATDMPHDGGRGLNIVGHPAEQGPYHAIVVTLGHSAFFEGITSEQLTSYAPMGAPMIDLRGLFETEPVQRHFSYWRP